VSRHPSRGSHRPSVGKIRRIACLGETTSRPRTQLKLPRGDARKYPPRLWPDSTLQPVDVQLDKQGVRPTLEEASTDLHSPRSTTNFEVFILQGWTRCHHAGSSATASHIGVCVGARHHDHRVPLYIPVRPQDGVTHLHPEA